MPITGGGAGGGHVFVARGDISEQDFTAPDLTLNGQWYDMDLSSAIPDSDAVAAQIKLVGRHSAAPIYFGLRPNGHSNTINSTYLRMQLNNVFIEHDCWVQLDEDLKIEYIGQGALDSINVCVKGWLKPA